MSAEGSKGKKQRAEGKRKGTGVSDMGVPTEHANFETGTAYTFEGVFEDFVLPFLSARDCHSRTPWHAFMNRGIELLQGFLPSCAEEFNVRHCPAPPCDLLPCGVPYKCNPLFLGLPLRLKDVPKARRRRRLKVLRRQAWINQMVCCASWVFLGRPAEGQRAESLCCQLSDVQLHAVRWLTDWTRVLAPPGRRIKVVFPRGRGLHGLVRGLAEASCYGRVDITHPAGTAEHEGTDT
eukprot:6468682-Amphidinium_carterae.1